MAISHPLTKCALLFLFGAALNIAAQASDTVPLKFINGIPFVTVTVGASCSRLMIDSGGSLGISIPQAAANESGTVTLSDKTTKFRDLKGDVYEVPNLVAKQVSIGNTKLGPVEGRIHVQWGGAPEGPDAELTKARQAGSIGVAAFGNRPIMFDYRLGTLTIYAPGEPLQSDQTSWHALPLDYGKEGPSVSLIVNGKPLKFVLDTGASVNLVNAGSLIQDTANSQCTDAVNGKKCDPRELGTVLDESGHAVGKLSAERTDFKGAPFDGILGAPFFKSYRVLFDFSAHRILLSPFDVDGIKL